MYLAPLRALAGELRARWQTQLSSYPVGIFTGDYSNGKYPVSFQDARLMVMTPERLDFCVRHWRSHWNWIPEVDLIVVDEFHLLGEGLRGARLEGTLLRWQKLNPFTRILGLSATLGNREELADWLDGVEYQTTWRPVPLTWRIVRYRKAEEKPTKLTGVLHECVSQGGKSLVFVQSRRRAEQLAAFLNKQNLRAAYHHAGLGHDKRQSIENGFRNHQLDVLIATATLEMGLNLPVRQVVL